MSVDRFFSRCTPPSRALVVKCAARSREVLCRWRAGRRARRTLSGTATGQKPPPAHRITPPASSLLVCVTLEITLMPTDKCNRLLYLHHIANEGRHRNTSLTMTGLLLSQCDSERR
ncbi:unnamed protein product [Leptidea sinapis]|uniref:Uncharacterized protein n=1 Tax=Leptidea sinapis TaxID=189913 RepID=A0A5E4QWI6_9NEOP|nr:unnamed protein product [Leptidea sinapis]